MLHRLALAAVLPLLSCSFPAPARADSQAAGTDVQILGALGDSISAGFNAKRLGDNRELSWSTGDSALVQSHLKRLEDFLHAPIAGVNEAIAGSVAANLERQTTRLLPHNPSFVTIDIGANDVCAWTPDNHETAVMQFETDVRASIQRLVDANAQVRVTIVPIPNVYNLWEVAHDQPGCQMRWDIIGLCGRLLGSQRTQAERLAFLDRLQEGNDALSRIASDYPQHVLFDEHALETPFTWEHISPLDCFHPSVLGQNLIAEKTWFYGR